MGLLRDVAAGALCALEAEHIVGRSPRATLRLDRSYVSGQHASVRWVDGSWELKDLGSRNGTLLNDSLIRPGKAFKLAPGDRISFGRAEQTWELADESPPSVMVVPLDDQGGPLFVEGDILAVPSQEDPQATVFRGSDGAWQLEREDGVVPLANHRVFEASGRRFRFACPDAFAETSTIDWTEGSSAGIAQVLLHFRVTLDEEHVEIRAQIGGRHEELGSRGHNYMLLLLARSRLNDAARGQPDTSCGWVYQEEFAESLRISLDRLSIDVFRIRRQFAGLGVSDAANIVERRPRTKQLRIGVSLLAIETI